MKNAEWCIKNNILFTDICCGPTCLGLFSDSFGYYDGIAFHELYSGPHLGESLAESILVWLGLEHEEDVLTNTEKLFLSSLVKPFKDRVQFILKTTDGCPRGHCGITIDFDDPTDNIYLPRFRASDMYKGMEMYKRYRLEELGL